LGSYERYVPPSEKRPTAFLGWIVAVLAVGVAGWLLISQRSTEVDVAGADVTAPGQESAQAGSTGPELDEVSLTASVGEPVGSPYAKDARIAELEMQLRDQDFALSRQSSEIASLEARVEELQQDSERYRAGLDQAVSELNQLRGEIGRLEGSVRAPTGRATGPGSTEGVHPVGAPYVTISSMGFVLVSGFVNNPTRAAARGKLQVSLVGSAGVIETRDFPMYIPPNKQERYDITFPGIFPTERIAAQASWVP